MAWYNANWTYRRKIVVTNNIASNLTNFQVLFTLDTAALVTAGKMQADGDDIIFADLAGVSQDYWIESGMNTNATKIWVEVKSITASSTKDIYLYYGNAGAGAATDGDATFDFFDDFNDGSLDASKWTVHSGTENTDFAETGGNLEIYTSSPAITWLRGTNLSRNRIFEHRARFSATTTSMLLMGTTANGAYTNNLAFYTSNVANKAKAYTRASGSITYMVSDTTNGDAITNMNTWKTYKFEWLDTPRVKIFHDTTQFGLTKTTNVASANMGAWFRGYTSGTGTLYINWTRARQYAATEPTHGAWGAEEVEYATTPTDIDLTVGSVNPVGGVTNVAIPAPGATDNTGAVTGWVTATADKIKFTVRDGGAATSAITINGGAYTNGTDYTVPSTANLTIIVTTSEAGRTNAVRTFTITVAAAPPAFDVDVTYLPIIEATIDAAITSARTGANNKYFNLPIVNDMQIMFIHITQ